MNERWRSLVVWLVLPVLFGPAFQGGRTDRNGEFIPGSETLWSQDIAQLGDHDQLRFAVVFNRSQMASQQILGVVRLAISWDGGC